MMVRLLAVAGCMVIACATAGRDQPNTQSDAPATDAPAVDIDANNCATQPCDILTQCGCPAAQACDIDGSDLVGTACRTVATTAKAEGGTCANTDACLAGNVCLSGGFCKKYCDASSDCGQPRGQCVIDIVDQAGMKLAGIPSVCSSNCDPSNVAAGGQCAAGAKCGLFVQTQNGVPHNIVDCSTAGTLVQGGNCEVGTTNVGNDKLCAPDHICTTPDMLAFTCRKVCNKTVGGGCGALTCSSLATPFLVGGIEYGICQ